MGNIYDMVLEIRYTKKSNDFYRYLAWRIQSVDIERENVRNGGKSDYPLFTKKSWKSIEKFVSLPFEYIIDLMRIRRLRYLMP